MRTILVLMLLGLTACAVRTEKKVVFVRGGGDLLSDQILEEYGLGDRGPDEFHADTLRLAVETLVEADRHEVAEMMEHALHAHELETEGRRDDEAREIMEDAPSAGEIVEGLMLTREILIDRGREDAAEEVALLEHRLRGRAPRGPHARHEHPDMAETLEGLIERHRHLARTLERFMERVERLEAEREEREER